MKIKCNFADPRWLFCLLWAPLCSFVPKAMLGQWMVFNQFVLNE